MLSKKILNNMLKTKRNIYPKNIIYRTERNRHLKSYWIKIHGINYGAKYAKVVADILNETEIKIEIKNSNGITLTLPPQINRKSFSIYLNGRVIKLIDYKYDRIILIKKNNDWETAMKEPNIDFRKGTGLLDIYLNKMRIIIPDNASEMMIRSARAFSTPITNSGNSLIYVNYPIYEVSNTINHIFSYNLILYDNCGNNSYVSELKDKLPIKYDQKGYIYKGRQTNGDYLIMQIIPNHYNNNLSILVISTNNEKLFSKSLFTRKVFIPFYFNGIHPFWNNQALIFYGGRYHVVYERDMDIKELK